MANFRERTLEKIIAMNTELVSYASSIDLDENYLTKSFDKVLETTCEILKAKRGEILIITDESQKIPSPGLISNNNKVKCVSRIGLWNPSEIGLIDFYLNEIGPGSPFWNIIQNKKWYQIYDNKEYIESEIGKNNLRPGYYQETKFYPDGSEVPPEDYRTTLIAARRKINDNYEVYGFVNIEDFELDIKPNEPIPNDVLGLALLTVDSASNAIVFSNFIDALNRKRLDLEKTNKELINTQNQLILSERFATIGKLSGEISHNLRNKITYLESNLRLIPHYLQQGNLEKIAEKISTTQAALKNLTDLSNRFESYSKTQAAEKIADIHIGLENLLGLVQENLEKSGIRIYKKFDPSIKPLKHKPADLDQVYTNLISNSETALLRKKSKNRSFKPEIKIETINDQSNLRVVFYDNGIGINKENIPRVFDPSYTTKTKAKGVGGFGLASCQRIIKEHNGSIEIQSEEGEYTKVILTLPI